LYDKRKVPFFSFTTGELLFCGYVSTTCSGCCFPYTGYDICANAVVQEGEFGVGLGAGHYFGDLNTRQIEPAEDSSRLFFP
jgi:hypothetical protein